jgi:hypothetical protein
MFCPNCGKDCGNANFCSHCGTRIQQGVKAEAKSAVWSVGMPCPYCGGTKLEGNNCAFCGAQLMVNVAKKDQKKISVDIPCGCYKGVSSSLTLYEKECLVSNTLLFFKKIDTKIPYDQIETVIFVRSGYRTISLGFLLFRSEGMNTEPITNDINYANDRTTISFSSDSHSNLLFYHIYYMLKTIAPSTAEFQMIVPSNDIDDPDDFASKVDLDAYFDRYAPFRQQAVDAMCQRTGAPVDVARMLIDKTFDARQQELYAADPLAALRDLNQIVSHAKQEKEKIKQKMVEARERSMRNQALYEQKEAQRSRRKR